MDPFKLIPDEIHDHLLQYFSVNEVLDVISLVSKSWYEITASSSNCMKRIKLNFRHQRRNDFAEKIEMVKWMSRDGARKYQHLQINCLLDEGVSNEVWKFLSSVSGSVETINIRSMKFDVELEKLSLPKLEELKVMFVPREGMNWMLKSSGSFRKLILRNEFPLCYDNIDYTPTEVTLESVRSCLKNNQKLEEIEIQGRPHFLSFFHETLPVIPDLKKFIVKVEMSPEKINPENEENFLNFLTRQAHCLEQLYIDHCGTKVIQHVFNKMPALTFIRFDIVLKEPNKFIVSEQNLEVNERIKQLELPYIDLLVDLKEFLLLVPNVEELLIGHVNPLFIEHAATHLPNLKSVVYRYDDCAHGCEYNYGNFKTNNPNVNQNMKFSLYNDFL